MKDLKLIEREISGLGLRFIAGIDEVGRGALAGPVVTAAVVLHDNFYLPGIRDSKQLSPRVRKKLFKEISGQALDWALGVAEPEVIDRINVLQATLTAMRGAIEGLRFKPQCVLVDGNIFIPKLEIPQIVIVKGDQLSISIAAASIIAKVTRDGLMEEWDNLYPQYGFSRHKGYATRQHLENLRLFGPCRIHRRSFKPCR